MSYPGYAPTGAIAGQPVDGGPSVTLPLAVLAGGMVLAAGAAQTVSRVRSRAPRTER